MHHAHLILGSWPWALSVLPQDTTTPSVDVLHYVSSERMGILDVRLLTHEAHLLPLVSQQRIFILAYSAITREAQNALLKLCEDPPRTACFYIVCKREAELLPTLRSRLMLFAQEETDVFSDGSFDSFMNASYRERLASIAEKTAEKDLVWISTCMDECERYASRSADPKQMQDIIQTRMFLESHGASKKMLLEHIALSF